MTKLKYVQSIFLFCLIVLFNSCKKGKEYVSESGLRYRLYTENTGLKPSLGDYVVIELVYRTKDDSVLFDSRINNTPMRFKLERIPFKSSYEEGLTYLAEGDSATFYIPADSLYNYYYRNSSNRIAQSETVFKKGTFLLFDVKLLDVQDYVEAEQDQMVKESAEEKKEQALLKSFLGNHDFESSVDSGFYWMKRIETGNGAEVKKGKLLTVQYTGKFLDGKVFDHAGGSERPFTFKLGDGQILSGLENACIGLKEGDRVELLIPSKHAYGSEGLLDANSASYTIPPFATLWYDLEILQVADTLSLVKR